MTNAGLSILITAPVTEKKIAGFTLDPFRAAVGKSIPELLSPILDGSVTRTTHNGAEHWTLPCTIPSGQGLSLGLGTLGELGMAIDKGLLVLSLPILAAHAFQAQCSQHIESGPRQRQTPNGFDVYDFGLRLKASTVLDIPLASFGALSLRLR